MSTADPFLPAPWPAPQQRDASEIDVDQEVDVILPGAHVSDDDEAAEPEFPENPVFRTPTPGDALTEQQLEADLEDE